MNRLEEAFKRFDQENPSIWTLFTRFAYDAANAGYATLSANFIFERIRWETTVVTRSTDEFKLNNNHRAYYARKWNAINARTGMPLFKLRAVKGDWNVI
jgi:hypothetical protein